MQGDLDKSLLISNSIWAASVFLSFPYKVFHTPPKKPPDGCVLRALVLLYAILVAVIAIIYSMTNILGIKLGIIWIQDETSKDSKDIVLPNACFAFTVVHALRSVDLNEYKAFASFDSNSETALVDNCANTHIWNVHLQFENFREIPKSRQGVSTIGGQPHFAQGIGDVPTSWKDDNGDIFRHTLKDVLFFPDSPVKIISSSKLATEWGPQVDHEGTSITSKYSYSYFVWNFGKYSRTIQHPQHCLPELSVNEGYSKLQQFCNYCSNASSSVRSQWFGYFTACPTISSTSSDFTFREGEILRYSRDGFTCKCKVIAPVMEDNNVTKYKIKLEGGRVFVTPSSFLQHPEDVDIACIPEKEYDYQKDLPTLSKEDLSYLAHPSSLSTDDKDWLFHHNRLNHLSRDDMHKLVLAGILPKKFEKYKSKSPFCASCAFGKAHRRQWTHKGRYYNKIRSSEDDKPGVKVSVDQMVSAQAGLVPQTSSHLTRSRIFSATIYIDHFSSFVFSFLQRSTTQDETLHSKVAFEKMANSYGVKIEGYHADNERFAEAAFRDDCKTCDQTITFCAVGAHHQNGIAEAGIKRFTLNARTCLLHAKRMWSEAITTMLWPFALQHRVEVFNTFHMDSNGRSPLMKFSGVLDPPNIDDFHPFGCPVYVLEAKLQSSSKGIPKWDPRARLGIYLGHSPVHAGSVALVLNPASGHVSPQYHVVFDDNFSTVSNLRNGTVPSNWAKLVAESSYCSTDEQYSLSETWFQETSLNPLDDKSTPPMINGLPGPSTTDSEGDEASDPPVTCFRGSSRSIH